MKQPLTVVQVENRLAAFDVALKALESVSDNPEGPRVQKTIQGLRDNFYKTHESKLQQQ